MDFKKYSSIERGENTAGNLSTFSRYILQKGWGDTLCIVEEKVHGTNFQISYDGSEFKYGRRTSFLTVEDNFFGNKYFDLVEPCKSKIEQIYTILKQRYPLLTQITLHAELAGGLRNGESTSVVQRKTNYSLNQFLYFYDIRIFLSSEQESEENAGIILNPLESKWFFSQYDMIHAKVLKTGRLVDLLRTPNFGDSEVTKELNPNELPDCVLEGYVIKSVESGRQYTGNDRIALKMINPIYEEVNELPSSDVVGKRNQQIDIEALDIIGRGKNYITSMRVDKVCGNLGISESNFESKMFSSILNTVMDDVIHDMKTDEIEIADKWVSVFRSRLTSNVALLIREKFFGKPIMEETAQAA